MSDICKETSNLGVTAVSGGISYNLNDRTAVRLEAYAGHGITNTRRLSQRTPMQKGDTDLGFAVDPRFPVYNWMIRGRDLPHYYELREMFLGIFRPRDNDPVQMVFTLPNGARRALDVNLDGALDLPPGSRTYTQHQFTVGVKASDGRFYDPSPKSLDFGVSGNSSGFTVPVQVPVPIGTSSINQIQTIFYASGSIIAAEEFPIITIFGPITNPVIENLTTGEKIDLSDEGGLVINTGEFVIVDLAGAPRRDSKTITNQDGESVEEFLTTDSDLATWHLSYNTEKLINGSRSDGNNQIRVTGSDINALTRVQITYYDRYKGF